MAEATATATASGRILVVDDDPAMGEMLVDGLKKRGYHVAQCTKGAEALALLGLEDFDVVVTDLRMAGMTGLELCHAIVENRPDLPVVVITAFGSMESAVAAIRAGAYDFITKPFELETLRLTLNRAVQHRRLRDEVKRLRRAVAKAQHLDELVGQSLVMQEVYDLVSRIAPTDASLLIEGESGTGKELVARAVHRLSKRAKGPFVAVNCASIPEPLLESQLFGHRKGAFTDASESHTGLFVQAHEGTLFLDEIGELPLALQPKLLRALQERKVRPLGAKEELPFNARILSATNRDLETAVEEKRFREDLYYRLNVVRIQLPPLRARGTDVLLLAQRFIEHDVVRFDKRSSTGQPAPRGLSAPAAQRLLEYAWPGNVRELQNCMERAVALARFDEILVGDLPEKIQQYRSSHVVVASDDPAGLVTMEEVERRYILRVLEAMQGSRRQAAEILGLDRKTLYRKLLKYGAPPSADD